MTNDGTIEREQEQLQGQKHATLQHQVSACKNKIDKLEADIRILGLQLKGWQSAYGAEHDERIRLEERLKWANIKLEMQQEQAAQS